jgi:hypothetical protein
MDWKKVGAKLAEFGLPILGSAIPGVGTIAGTFAGKLIAAALGEDPESMTPEGVIDSLQTNPEALVRLKEIAAQHDVELRQIALENERLYFEDIKNARQREVEITRATGKRDVNLYVLAYIVVVGFFGTLGTMFYFMFNGSGLQELPQSQIMLIGMLFGTLTTGLATVFNYFFGSSKGSSDKTKLLASAPAVETK